MKKIIAQRLLIFLFSTLLAACQINAMGFNTPTPSPSLEPSATTIPTPVPTDILFPESSVPTDKMMAQLIGKLILVNGCPRMEATDGSSILLIWPYNYSIDRNTQPAQIRDDTGQIVAKIGDYVEMGGGETPIASNDSRLPKGCAGPVWIVGNGPKVLDAYFPSEAGVGGFSSMTDALEGKLVLDNGCLRLQTDANKRFLLIWPTGHYHRDANSLQVYDLWENVLARVGEKIRVIGGEAPSLQSPPGDIRKPMVVQPLPKECSAGPYWNVEYIDK